MDEDRYHRGVHRLKLICQGALSACIMVGATTSFLGMHVEEAWRVATAGAGALLTTVAVTRGWL